MTGKELQLMENSTLLWNRWYIEKWALNKFLWCVARMPLILHVYFTKCFMSWCSVCHSGDFWNHLCCRVMTCQDPETILFTRIQPGNLQNCCTSVFNETAFQVLSLLSFNEPELCPDSLQLRTMLRGWSSTCQGETASASVHSAISKTDCVPCQLPLIALPATRPTPWTTMTWTWRSWSRFLVYFLFFLLGREWLFITRDTLIHIRTYIDTLYTDFKFCLDRCIWFSPRKLCCFSVTM